METGELDRLAKELAKAGDEKIKEATRELQQVGRIVKTRAQLAAPRDRPWLALHGIHRKTWKPADGVHVDVFTGEDERGVNVGFYAEFGTADTAPRPFLTTQVPYAESEVVERLSRILNPFDPVGPQPEASDD